MKPSGPTYTNPGIVLLISFWILFCSLAFITRLCGPIVTSAQTLVTVSFFYREQGEYGRYPQ